MIIPTLTYIYDRRHQATSSRPALIELRVTHDRKQIYINTGIKVLPKCWRNGVVAYTPEANNQNATLNMLMLKVRTITNDMLMDGTFHIDAIKPRLEHDTLQRQTFIDYGRERAAKRCGGNQESTLKRYFSFLDWLDEWGVIKLFTDITEQNITLMDEELAKSGMKTSSRYSNYHKYMKAIIKDAMADNLITCNPYAKLHIKKTDGDTVEKLLTPDEFRKIEKCTMPTESLTRVRDLFIFQTYTCLSYVDLAAFDYSKVRMIGSSQVYTGRRKKTGQEFSFVLLKPALNILKKYNYKLPVISNVKYDLYLKAVAAHAKIDKPVSSHWARHTGATLLLNSGMIPISVVSKILGHSTSKITEQVYAKLLDNTIVTAMQAYNKKLR